MKALKYFLIILFLILITIPLRTIAVDGGEGVLIIITSDDHRDVILSSIMTGITSFIVFGKPFGIIVPWSTVYLIIIPFGIYNETYMREILELKPIMAIIIGNNVSVPIDYEDILKSRGVSVKRIGGRSCQERSILIYKMYIQAFLSIAPFSEYEFPPRMKPIVVSANNPCIPWNSFPIWFINITDELISFIRRFRAEVHYSLMEKFKDYDVIFTNVDLIQVFRDIRGFRILSQYDVLNELREAYLPRVLPKFIIHDFTNLSKVKTISKFRSCAGHEFPDSFENGSSLKHYFEPYDEYKETIDKIEVYSPVDGTIIAMVPEGDVEYRGIRIHIIVDDYPGFMIEIFHTNPFPNITIGRRVKAGDLLGYFYMKGAQDFDIAVSYISPIGIKYYSYFDVMDDSVFIEYKRRGIFSRDQMKFSYEERIGKPCDFTCGHKEDWVTLSETKKSVALVTLKPIINDYLIQYGETNLKLLILNLGEVDAKNITVKIFSVNGIEINQSIININTLNGGDSCEIELKLHPLISGSRTIIFQLSYLDEENRRCCENYTLPVRILKVCGELMVKTKLLKLKVAHKYNITATIRNTGQANTKYTLEVEGINVKIISFNNTFNIPRGCEYNVTFTIIPLSEGLSELKLKLLAENILQNITSISIEAWKIKGKLNILEAPKKLTINEESKISLLIINTGKINATYMVKVISENIEVSPRNITLKIPSESNRKITFKIKPLKEGVGSILIELIGDNKLIDSKEFSIEIKSIEEKFNIMIIIVPIIIIIAITFILIFKKHSK